MTQATMAPPAPTSAKGDAPVVLRAFRIGVQQIDEDLYDEVKTLSASVQTMRQYNIPATAFLRNVYLYVTHAVTASTGTATGTGSVGVLKEDGAYAVIDSFQFTDTNGQEIIGPVSGYDLKVISKFGGYCFDDDPETNTDIFSATSNATASSSASGSFSFVVRIPLELVPRDALGSLVNKSSSTPFKVKMQLAAIASVFVNAATIGGELRVRMTPDSYWEPTAQDGSGNPVANLPPGVNTTQYWNVTPYMGLNPGGNGMAPMLDNSVGFPVRNLIFCLRDDDATNPRATGETDFPSPFQLQLQSNLVINRIKPIWKKYITEDYGYGAAGDTAGRKDNGVYLQPFCKDFGHKPGWETRRGYLRTSDGMRMQAKGTIGGTGSHTLTVYTNYVGLGSNTLASVTT
jgi:hypothetical protein